jgi:DNA/RNA endonuclease YhcR with UshA esterase domain
MKHPDEEKPEQAHECSQKPEDLQECPSGDVPRGMTLEGLVTMTGEMEHLNELVLLHVEKAGGFTCTASYLTIVTPILDMLEGEIRFRYRNGMDHAEIKSIIADWIDQEIAGMRPG